jgi:hypothetical protein
LSLFKTRLLFETASCNDPIAKKQSFHQCPLLAYTLGFMTHAALDRATHPYIVYKSTMLAVSERFA